ncbi:serine/arginine repetitive matrix protein 1 isoform X2 [Diachasma alloeum]|uniref:serine/arginine repetitive matrix protein 1 isoform X2 n=1 Tax=Diachasma alloeum TaxID=454923 RepID=UPI0007382FAA|nr:serine/arginine repetitive matrix protein 1 isoform X2 [Diachasma alloeum]
MSRSTRLRKPPSRFRTDEPPPEAENPSPNPRKGIGDKRVDNDPETRINTRGSTKKSTSAPDDENKKKTIVKGPTRPSSVIKKHPPPVPSRSSKNSGVQVTEKEPDDVEKPRKIPTRITRKVSKDPPKSMKPSSRGASPRSTKSSPRTRPEGPEAPGNVPRTTRSKTSSAAGPKPPDKPEKIERKSKRLTKPTVKSPQKPEKKFFKNKRNITLTHSKVSPMKRGLRLPRRPLRTKTSPSRIRQPTLAESFAKVKKTLRPRRTAKNYNEETIVERKKPEAGGDHPKPPVYKTLSVQENPKDKEEIYEFSFDANDSSERLQRKRKKRTVRKAPAKRAKKMIEGVERNPEELVKKVDKKIPVGITKSGGEGLKKALGGEKIRAAGVGVVPEAVATTSRPRDQEEKIKKTSGKIPGAEPGVEIGEKGLEGGPGVLGEASRPLDNHQNVPEACQIPEEAPASPAPSYPSSSRGNSPAPEHFEVIVDVHVPSDTPSGTPGPSKIPSSTPKTPVLQSKKPTMFSNERLEGDRRISLTSTPLHAPSDSTGPTSAFTNRPSTQYKTMMNHSLIRRSFSPIVKQNNDKVDCNFDPSSPWRPIATNTFSRVKNVFQSTPQGKKVLTPHGIHSLTTENKRAMGKINKIVEESDSSVVEAQNKSPRKFGTVLGNVSSPGTASPRMSEGSSAEDKENQVSPRKSKRVRTPLGSPLRPLENERMRDEASGVENEKVVREERVLRQSNLHGFLGIPEMPASTSISTAHGIFDEGEGIVPGRSAKRPGEQFSVGNAFGFEEESWGGQDESSGAAPGADVAGEILKKVEAKEKGQKKVEGKERVDVENIRKKIVEKRPVRMPTRPVQKVVVEDLDKIEKEKERVEVSSGDVSEDEGGESVVRKETHEATKKDLVEAGHFLDTFDAEERETSPVEVPLFVDPEPVHFRQPPRYSYGKRKRGFHHNTSDETEDIHSEEEDEDHFTRKTKKRKMTKAEKEQQKKLDEWAKSVNQTFDEIEHFDLIVE